MDNDQCGGAYGFESEAETPSPPPQLAAQEEEDMAENDGDIPLREDHVVPEALTDELFARHIDVVNEYVEPVPTMRTYGYVTQFSFTTVEGPENEPIEDVAQLVTATLQRLINTALDNAAQHGQVPGSIGVTWQTELMTNPFVIPLGNVRQNNASKILTEFDRFDQSAKDNDLYGQIITVNITIVDHNPGAGHRGRPVGSTEKFTPCLSLNVDHALLKINNTDALCLFKAVCVAKFYADLATKQTNSIQPLLRNDALQTMRARDLMAEAGITEELDAYGLQHLTAVQRYLDRAYPTKYRILCFTASGKGVKVVFNGKTNAEKTLSMWYSDGHYDAVKTPQKLLNLRNGCGYCPACETVYSRKCLHSTNCSIICKRCLQMGHGYPEKCRNNDSTQHRLCNACGHTFETSQCFNDHLKSACRLYHRCGTCKKAYSVAALRGQKHECGSHWCRTCYTYQPKEHDCFIKVSKPRTYAVYRIIVYDIESIIVDYILREGLSLHVANVVTAKVTCTRCINAGRWENLRYNTRCEVCGPSKMKTFVHWREQDPSTGEWLLQDPMIEFVEWVLRGDEGFTDTWKKWPSLAYAHNAAKYDAQFVLKELIRRHARFNVINNGLKIMQIDVASTKDTTHAVFRDTVLLFPMKLEAIPKTFGVQNKVPDKPYYPYRTNSVKNYTPTFKGLPPPEDYLPMSMSTEKRKHFETVWYPEESRRRADEWFDIKRETVTYCENDTLQLLYGVVLFRKMVNDIAKADVFYRGLTITSLCMNTYKSLFMPENNLAIVPTNGYERHTRQSAKAIRTLKYLADAHNIEIQHRNSNGGERRFGRYTVDGYIPHGELQKPAFTKCARAQCYCRQTDGLCTCALCKLCTLHPEDPRIVNGIVVEVNGCAYHGCNLKTCFTNNTVCLNGRTSDENFLSTVSRQHYLTKAHGLFVYSVQECVIDGWLKRFPEIRQAYGEYFDDGPIDPRDGFFGGSVGPLRQHWKLDETKPFRARYLDINSLYPSVLAGKKYPIGHPTTIAHDDDLCRRVRNGEHWTKEDDNPIKGILKVRVVPPNNLLFPVIPHKDDERLLFPLCRTCAISSRKKSPFKPPRCAHTETERSFVTTTNHVELGLALRKGYKIVDLIGYYDWPDDSQWSDELFKAYIHAFVKLKEENSGWAAKGIDPEQDPDARIKMEQYMEEYAAKQGILIDIDNVVENDGLRYVIKLFLNSLWGRFAMRTDRMQAEFVDSHKRLLELLATKSIDILTILGLGDSMARVTYRYKKQVAKEDSNSNLFIAIFTTGYGRTCLYDYMCRVDERMGGAKGSFLLYRDTDSVCYVEHAKRPPLTPGRFLGEMTDECAGHTIVE